MAEKTTKKKAIQFINESGALLVYPINNAKLPASLWSKFFPKSAMRWVWDNGADFRVAEIWHLREELSRSSQVVYVKWFKGRATFFSKKAAVALMSYLGRPRHLSRPAKILLNALLEESPQSTKKLKKGTKDELAGESFDKAMRELWESLLIVGRGEVDDGAFPSLNVGAMEHLHEGLWEEADRLKGEEALKILIQCLGDSPFVKQILLLKKKQGLHRSSGRQSGRPNVITGDELSVFSGRNR